MESQNALFRVALSEVTVKPEQTLGGNLENEIPSSVTVFDRRDANGILRTGQESIPMATDPRFEDAYVLIGEDHITHNTYMGSKVYKKPEAAFHNLPIDNETHFQIFIGKVAPSMPLLGIFFSKEVFDFKNYFPHEIKSILDSSTNEEKMAMTQKSEIFKPVKY
jgi:hypothetical protein